MKQQLIGLDHSLISIKDSLKHGKGVFTNKNIQKGTYILEYLGEIISTEEGNKREREQREIGKKTGVGQDYIFELNKNQDIDGNFDYNIARLINHSCVPNCEFLIEDNRVWIIAKVNINKGDELTLDYGYDDIEDYKNNPCKCGHPNCIGYIIGEEFREELLERLNSSNEK